MTATTQTTATPMAEGKNFRWLQLAMGIVCMAMIANLQYGWTLFVDPIDAKYHWGRAAIQLAFTLFVVTETWLVPVEAWFVDKYGPSIVVRFGGVMIAIAWVLNSYADSLVLLYIGAIYRRNRRRLGLRNMRRQCPEMVSGSPRPRRRRNRRRLRCGCCDHRSADRAYDCDERLSACLLHVRHRSRRDRFHPCIFPAQAFAGDAGEEEAAQSARRPRSTSRRRRCCAARSSG